jgi:hypothetical protein
MTTMWRFNPKNRGTRIDPCLRQFIENLNWMMSTNDERLDIAPWWQIVACCCGHGTYPMTIVAKDQRGMVLELVSGSYLKRKSRFYKTDKQGRSTNRSS